MSTDTQQVVSKAWNFAHVLRDDGLSYMAYVEQITFLLFLKMADEQTKPPYNRKPIVPAGFDWASLLTIEGQVDANLKRAARLRQGILKRAFEGCLVPQDLTDEPAENMLERIRRERQSTNRAHDALRRRRAGKVRKLQPPGQLLLPVIGLADLG